MKESWSTWLSRHYLNLYPCYRGTGGKVTFIASDWHEVRVELPLNRKTRNYVGTIFGGSLYSSIDPIYMLMLIKILGPGYIVWDKAASIRFKKPGNCTLYATMNLTPPEIEKIKSDLKSKESVEAAYLIEFLDKNGTVYASVEKVIYVTRSR
jgi:acyl-coenzyme A thioesterase PaaI-like protein